jgi:hypothetical protein
VSKANGQVRSSQVITTYGPGALIDLPRDSGIVGGLEGWPSTGDLREIVEPRLVHKLSLTTGVSDPRLYAPPPDENDPRKPTRGIDVWRFPEWYLVQDEPKSGEDQQRSRSRRLVHRRKLDDKGKFDGRPVVAIRFVRACPRGHVDDLDWYSFVHGPEGTCRQQLWLDETGTSGDLADLWVRCECGDRRRMSDAAEVEASALGTCSGRRPWLGVFASEDCMERSRLLVRTATNAYFPQVMSVLSLPDRGSDVVEVVRELWDRLQIADDELTLSVLKKMPGIADRLGPFSDQEVLDAVRAIKQGTAEEKAVKLVELDALLAAPLGYGDDVPIDPDFHARRLPDHIWRHSVSEGVERVIQLHRLREVLALAGFTRFEAVMPDIDGEYDTDVQVAQLALEPRWFPAVENRGEGIFIQLSAASVGAWMQRDAVERRLGELLSGHEKWAERRKRKRSFPGGPYVLLHTLSHLLIQSLAMRCGYPASSVRERIYADVHEKRYGILLYTGSPDAEGTLGGLVQEARHIEQHLAYALRLGALCSNDPICAQHAPGESMEERWLHGAACHGCTLIAETSCEMRNDYLDRALVVPVLGMADAAFFTAIE